MWGIQHSFEWWMPFYGMGTMLFMLAIVGLMVWGILRLATHRGTHTGTGEAPAGILRGRLARGEITSQQFEELQEILQKSARKA